MPRRIEVYVADGFVNHRVVVFDAATGAYKRHWTGRAMPFKTGELRQVAKDGTVYVCDRGNNRVQAFDKNGKFLKQGVVSQDTQGTGSVWDIAFSSDPQQRYLFVADGHDQKILILRRDTLAVASAASATAAATRARSTASAASPSTRRATSTRAKPRGQTRAEVHAEGRRR